MQLVSEYFPWVIGILAGLNVLLWLWLVIDSKFRKAQLRNYLANAVGNFRRSDIAHNQPIDERINFFIHDIREVIAHPHNPEEATELLTRLTTKDEERLYLKTHWFEVRYSVARTFIEIFPLLGIVGTVIAIAAGLATSGPNDADRVNKVVQNFGYSVLSTAIGLGAAIFFMFANSLLEPGFERLLEYADRIRDLVAEAKRRLGFVSSGVEAPQ
jgi:biopolymer transport protein ExbB